MGSIQMIDISNQKIAICLLARTNSVRLPRKAFLEIKGKPTIWHLCNKLSRSKYPLFVAIPESDSELDTYLNEVGFKVFKGSNANPLHRMVQFADKHGLDHVIRVTHDDLFIDIEIMHRMTNYHLKADNDYTYTALIPEGAGCEIFKTSALRKAYEKNRDTNIEGVSNYFRNEEYKIDQYRPDYAYQYPQYRLTMDYPEDFTLISLLYEQLPFHTGEVNALDVINYLKSFPTLTKINKLPRVSVYIPNYNYSDYLDLAITSVLTQTFDDLEIIVIDDCSTDSSVNILKKYINPDSRVKVIFNEKNIGLPASANKAISISRGEYILRVDSDDMLLPDCIEKLVAYIDGDIENEIGMVFPGYINCDKDMNMGEKRLPPFNGNENEHHPSGALIKRRFWNDIMYDQKLKGLESYDFYKRFSAKFNVGLLQEVCWLKRDHSDSMMYTDTENREKIKREIDGRN